MYIVNANKEIIDLSQDEYILTNGEVFLKEDVLNENKNYIWNAQGKFIDTEKIAYVTNKPYFDKDLKQYVCIVKIDSNTHKIQRILEGNLITLKNIEEKGLVVEVDGNVMYITSNGQIIH